jgi:hypothetical protein
MQMVRARSAGRARRVSWLFVLGLGAAACARVGYVAPRSDGDAVVDGPTDRATPGGDGTSDRGPLADAAELVAQAPFGRGHWELGAAVPVVALNSERLDSEACVLADGVTAYFTSDRPGGAGGRDAYRARRSGPNEPFAAPVNLVELNLAGSDSLTTTADDLTGYLASVRPGGPGNVDLWVGTRASVEVPWTSSAFRPLVQVNSPRSDWDPMPARDGLALYFAPEPATGPSDQTIHVADRASQTAEFGPSRVVLELQAAGVKSADPTLSPDQRVIVFNRGADLWYAVRPRRDAPFAAPEPIPEINTDAVEDEPCISGDGRELHFSSDRPGGKGSSDIWVVRIAAGP